MWIRINENELKKTVPGNNEKKLLHYWGFFVFVFLLIITLYNLHSGYIQLPKEYGNNHSQNLSDSIAKIPAGLFILFILILFTYYIIEFVSIESKRFICDKCNTVKEKINEAECDCGGAFVNWKLMKWNDEDNNK